MDVVIWDRDEVVILEVVEGFCVVGVGLVYLELVDVLVEEEVDVVIVLIFGKFGCFDCVLVNVGFNFCVVLFLDMISEMYYGLLNVNLYGVFYILRVVL